MRYIALCLLLLASPFAIGQQRNLSVASAAANENHVALVIGNGTYKDAPLRNPTNDASDMAAALRALGWKVTLRTNASQRQMKEAIRDFGRELARGGVGLFYFAGHGIQYRGENYLVPVSANIEREADVEDETVGARFVLSQMEEARNRVNIVIMDACRNNPYSRSFRSASRGLAQMDAAQGTLVAFATAPGSVASDGDGRNGIYTKHLLRQIRAPGVPAELMFKRVRDGVIEETKDRQTPWESSSLRGADFYFNPPAGGAQVASVAPSGSPVSSPAALELELWNSVKDSKNADDFKTYLDEYPRGRYVALARVRLRALEAAPPTQVASAAPNIASSSPPLVDRPVGKFTGYTTSTLLSGRKLSGDVEFKANGEFEYVSDIGSTLKGILDFSNPQAVIGTGTVQLPKTNGVQVTFADGSARANVKLVGNFTSGVARGVYTSIYESGEFYFSPVAAQMTQPQRVGGLGVPGTVFRDCDGCPEMVAIAAGSFLMGSPNTETGRSEWEGPQHRVTIARAFAAGKFEVTFEEWDACVRESGCKHQPDDEGWGRGRRPVINVDWSDAKQYTVWLSKKSGKAYRLLTEAEWEYVARAGTTTAFSFGNSISPQQANFNSTVSYAGSSTAVSAGKTQPVGSYPANAFGLHDVHGNAWEWTEDCWRGNYGDAKIDGTAMFTGDLCIRVMRGGSWLGGPQNLRSANRNSNHWSNRLNSLGLRVARTD